MLAFKAESSDTGNQVLVFFESAFLAPVGLEFIAQHAHGNASLAAIAIGPVGEESTSPEASIDQFRVNVVLNEVARGGYLRTGFPIVQIAAGVGRSGIKLQSTKRQILQVRHAFCEPRQWSQSI
jgi:hypothetical protein